MFWERYESLCQENDLAPTSAKMREVLNIRSAGTIPGWKRNGSIPDGDTLARITSYFCVSMPYLLGYTEVRTPPAPLENEKSPHPLGRGEGGRPLNQELYDAVKNLTPEDIWKVVDFARYLASQREP